MLVVHNVPAVKIEGIKLMPGLNYWQEKGWRVELRGSEFWALPPEGARNPIRQSDPMRLTLDGGATHPKAK